jgi:hypothetical protein
MVWKDAEPADEVARAGITAFGERQQITYPFFRSWIRQNSAGTKKLNSGESSYGYVWICRSLFETRRLCSRPGN